MHYFSSDRLKLTLRTRSGIWAEAKAPAVKGLQEGQYRVNMALLAIP
jgi:hypothetical protein